MVSLTLYTEGSGVLGDRENRIAAHLTAFRDNFHTLHQATSRSMSDPNNIDYASIYLFADDTKFIKSILANLTSTSDPLLQCAHLLLY